MKLHQYNKVHKKLSIPRLIDLVMLYLNDRSPISICNNMLVLLIHKYTVIIDKAELKI